MSKLPKIIRLLLLCSILKEVSDEADFLHADKYESLIQNDTMILMGMARYSQSSQNDTLAMTLQYLKKEVRNGVHFLHADKHQSFYKLALSFLIKVVRHVQGTQKRKLVIFSLYIKKKVSQLLLCSILMQIIQIFYGGQVMFVETWH